MTEQTATSPQHVYQSIQNPASAVGATAPTVGSIAHTVRATAPTVGATAPTVGATAPTVGATAPTVRATAPTIGATAPTVRATAPTNQSANQPQGNSSECTTGSSQNTGQSNKTGPTYGELGIITERPKTFEYAVTATRFASFEHWARDHQLKKEDLSAAGFYYADTRNRLLERNPAVLAVVEMGYREQDVIVAAMYIKKKYGMLSSHMILERLVDRVEEDRGDNDGFADSNFNYIKQNHEKEINELKEENGRLRQQSVCKICRDKEVAVVFLPCGHFVSCTDCAARMKDRCCPVCRTRIDRIVRAFMG